MGVVVGTAGHIDHGKTTLLRALTGIDADRLPEERRRGMTIDVGYAHLRLDDGTELDFVDVPGHDRLVGNMLVGAGEVDAAMLVVAADDGPRAQTLEHLELLDGLGISHGIAVVTKADTVTSDRAADVAASVELLLARTTLRDAAVLVASGLSGEGLDRLVEALVALRDRVAANPTRGPAGAARLAVDRSFSIRGRGTVITGTLRGGPIDVNTRLRVVPGGATARIRGLQVHGRDVARAQPGRTAINLAGVEPAVVGRGTVLTTDPSVEASNRILVALRLAPTLGSSSRGYLPADGSRVLAHIGTARVEAVVGRRGRDTAALPEGETVAILRLARAVAVAPGDRLVLRRPSPAATLAGGRVLDAEPPRGVSRRRSSPERLAQLAAAAPGTEAWLEARVDLHGVAAQPTPRLAPDVDGWLEDRIVGSVIDSANGATSRALLRTEIARELRRRVTLDAVAAANFVSGGIERLAAAGRVAAEGDRLRDPSRTAPGPTPDVVAAMARLERLLDVPAPPPLTAAAGQAGCPPDAVRDLQASGRIVLIDDDLAYSAAAYRTLEKKVLALASTAPLTPATLRDATGTSRKYVMAILEDLGRRGVLRRTPDGHVPGPRAAIEVAR
ncbi:MAG: selenocysteine-specific translation elongation factor [Chloroflexota bacterium]